MQPPTGGQACSFSRMRGNKEHHYSTGWVKIDPNGLNVPRGVAEGLQSAMDQHLATQKTASYAQHGDTNVANFADRAPTWTDERIGSYQAMPVCNPIVDLPPGMNPTTQHLDVNMHAFGAVQSNDAAVSESLQHYPQITQSQQMFTAGGQHVEQHHSQHAAISPAYDFYRNEIAGGTGLHQQNLIHPTYNNAPISALINHPPGAYAINASEATFQTATLLGNEYSTPAMPRVTTGEIVLVSPSQKLPNEVISLDTPPRDNSQLTSGLFYKFEPSSEQSKGAEPTQLETVDTPSPITSPSKNVAAQSGKNVRDVRNPVSKRNPRRSLSPSIDVDNDDDNARRGRNRPVLEDAIDLSKESSEETRSKLKRQVTQKDTEPQEKSFKIRKVQPKSNEGTAGTDTVSGGYQDPLNQTHRRHQDPPPRPFQENADLSQSPRRSPRLTKKSRFVNIGAGSGGFALSENSPGDCQVPLGGIPKASRERTSDGNSFMNRNRSTVKRRRANHAKADNPLEEESNDPCNVGKRNSPAMRHRNVGRQTPAPAQRPKRRTKREGRTTSRKENSRVGTVNRTLCVRQKANDDSDDEFFTAMNRRKDFGLTSQECEEKHPGDSPLSNTVGDGSPLDDDDIGAGGNELSSNDEAPPSPKRSPRGSRNRRGGSRKRARFDVDKARTSRAVNRKTIVSRGVDISDDCDDGNVVESGRKSSNKDSKEGAGRSPNPTKTKEFSMTPLSPVNLVSPTASRSKLEKTRRSTRLVRKAVRADERTDVVSSKDSDEDFDDSNLRARGSSKISNNETSSNTVTRTASRRLNSSTKQGSSQSNVNTGMEQLQTTNVEGGTSDDDAVSSDYSQEDEDTDAPEEALSQEQGSQPIQLKVKTVRKRRKANPKEFPESAFKKMSPDELAIIRIAFIRRYPAPPSNMQAQGRYEAAHGTEMSAGMVQRTWETQLKPWSDRWWKLYLNFNTVVREKKLRKPRDKDPTIKEKEVKKWVDEYYQEHGDAKPATTEATASEKA